MQGYQWNNCDKHNRITIFKVKYDNQDRPQAHHTTQYIWLARSLARPIFAFAIATANIRYTQTL